MPDEVKQPENEKLTTEDSFFAAIGGDDKQQDQEKSLEGTAADSPDGTEGLNGDKDAVDQAKQTAPAAAVEAPVDVAALQKTLEDTRTKLKRESGRTSALNRKLKDLSNQFRSSIPQLPDVKEIDLSEMSEFAPGSAEQIAKWTAQQQQTAVEHNKALRTFADSQSLLADQSAKEQAFQAVEDALPGWTQDTQKPEFSAWLQGLPPGIQSLAASDHPEDAVYLISQFRQSQAPLQAARTQAVQGIKQANDLRLQQAAAPLSRAPSPAREGGAFGSIEDAFFAQVATRQ